MPYQVERANDFVGVIKHSSGQMIRISTAEGAEETTKRIARCLNVCEQIPDKQLIAGVAPLAYVNEDVTGTPIVQTALPPGEVKALIANGCSPRAIAQAFFGMSVEQIEEVVREIIETPEPEPA